MAGLLMATFYKEQRVKNIKSLNHAWFLRFLDEREFRIAVRRELPNGDYKYSVWKTRNTRAVI